jgi:hypothetical protein
VEDDRAARDEQCCEQLRLLAEAALRAVAVPADVSRRLAVMETRNAGAPAHDTIAARIPAII